VNTNSGRGGLLILGELLMLLVEVFAAYHVASGSFRLARKILGRDTSQFPSGDK
jgi:hypothetical protein